MTGLADGKFIHRSMGQYNRAHISTLVGRHPGRAGERSFQQLRFLSLLEPIARVENQRFAAE